MDYVKYFLNFESPSRWLLALLLLGITFLFWRKNRVKLPPGPICLPILGYLPFLGDEPHVKMFELSKKYGDIYSLYLGRTYVVVVTGVDIIKELFNQSSTNDRPLDHFEVMPGGVGFAELNGREWIEQRRYTLKELKNLGLGRSDWEKLVQVELEDFLGLIEQHQGKAVDIFPQLSASVSNNVLCLLTGRRLPVDDPKRNILDRGIEAFETLFNQSGIVNYYPKLFGLAVKLGLFKAGPKIKAMGDMNRCVRQEIEAVTQDKDGHSYVQEYLKEVERNKQMNLKNSFNETTLIGSVQALILASSDTTKVSLLWLFLAMASFPDIQYNVQKELDTVLKQDESINWADRLRLPYCHATILEGQRWRTVVPLNVLHMTNEDITIQGYTIPKGSCILSVIWAFHNDPRHWKDPAVFQPKRFLTEDGQKIRRHEAYMPFSIGKRMCPGVNVAYIQLFMYFVNILRRFRILPATEDDRLNLVGFPGLTLQPPKHQQLRFVPR